MNPTLCLCATSLLALASAGPALPGAPAPFAKGAALVPPSPQQAGRPNAQAPVAVAEPSEAAPKLRPRPQELALRYFRPAQGSLHELRVLGIELFGDRVAVLDDEGPGGVGYVDRFLEVGGVLLVRDEAAQADSIVRQLGELELQIFGQPAQAPAEPELVRWEYAPRFVSIDALRSALTSFEHRVGNRLNLEYAPERKLVLALDRPRELAELRAFVERFDQPSPAIMLRCRLLSATQDSAQQPALEPALVESLAQLSGSRTFASFGECAVRGTTDAVIEIKNDFGSDGPYELRLEPGAYDPATRTVSFSSCSFECYRVQPNIGGEERLSSVRRFKTRLSIRAGEPTVLGSIGAQPIFVVLELSVDARGSAAAPAGSAPR